MNPSYSISILSNELYSFIRKFTDAQTPEEKKKILLLNIKNNNGDISNLCQTGLKLKNNNLQRKHVEEAIKSLSINVADSFKEF